MVSLFCQEKGVISQPQVHMQKHQEEERDHNVLTLVHETVSP